MLPSPCVVIRGECAESGAESVGAGQGLPQVVDQSVYYNVDQADCCNSHVFESVDHSAAPASGQDEVYVYEVVNVKRGVKYDGEIVVESEVVYEDVGEESEVVYGAGVVYDEVLVVVRDAVYEVGVVYDDVVITEREVVYVEVMVEEREVVDETEVVDEIELVDAVGAEPDAE